MLVVETDYCIVLSESVKLGEQVVGGLDVLRVLLEIVLEPEELLNFFKAHLRVQACCSAHHPHLLEKERSGGKSSQRVSQRCLKGHSLGFGESQTLKEK